MLKYSLIIFVALTVITVILGLPHSESNGPRPGYCRQFDIDIKEGEKVPAPIGHCLDLMCRKAETNDLAIISCGLIAKKAGCDLKPEDNVSPYPECCARNICKDNTN